jgi:ubiquinone biosynthesis monooxygenase Coq7
MSDRHYNTADTLLLSFDQALRTLFGQPKVTGRPNPAERIEETELDERQRDHIARLLRIDHTGEVCAQGLYQGQALTARDPLVRDAMEQSADEENDHLAWCQQRIEELGGRTSLLNPLWYAGSLAIGATAGLAGDRWSLGFVGETERQVEAHLQSHLNEIPPEDRRSRAILEQMKIDEIEHGEKAMRHGGTELPAPVKLAMKLASRVMTKSVYYL